MRKAVIVAALTVVLGLVGAGAASAASHREAPLISLDPSADITDYFMYRSYESGQADKVELIMDTTSEEPSSGPNYWNFDPSVLYRFNVDNDSDGVADDVQFEFRFQNEFRGTSKDLQLFLPDVSVPGPITSLDSPGLGLRQKYTLTMIKDGKRTVVADGLIAAPSNIGPRTTPNYERLARQAVYSLPGGIRVFAGQRDDPFYIDLGAVFDTLNLRSPGVDMLSGFNVQEIALEVPMSMISDGSSVIGGYAETARQKITVEGEAKGTWTQVQRLANPLVNEVIIGTVDKDHWNAVDPEEESQFLDYYLHPRLATALEAVGLPTTACTPFGGPTCSRTNRTDLVNVLLKYDPSDTHLSELLRLNLNVAATPLASQKRLTILQGDNAGWPNGRRPIDDVTDIGVQIVGGPTYIGLGAGDNVNANDRSLPDAFPFLASPWDGRGRVHLNP
jgi:Domain of unknown function (DUF4331)